MFQLVGVNCKVSGGRGIGWLWVVTVVGQV